MPAYVSLPSCHTSNPKTETDIEQENAEDENELNYDSTSTAFGSKVSVYRFVTQAVIRWTSACTKGTWRMRATQWRSSCGRVLSAWPRPSSSTHHPLICWQNRSSRSCARYESVHRLEITQMELTVAQAGTASLMASILIEWGTIGSSEWRHVVMT